MSEQMVLHPARTEVPSAEGARLGDRLLTFGEMIGVTVRSHRLRHGTRGSDIAPATTENRLRRE